VEQHKILWIVSQINGKNNTKFGKLFPTCGTTKTSLGILSWINNASNKKLGKLLPTCGTTTNSLGIFFQINSRNNTKYAKLFPTCGTTKTSLGILSWINNASNKKLGKLLVEQQQILCIFSQINSRNNTKYVRWNNKNFFGHFAMDQNASNLESFFQLGNILWAFLGTTAQQQKLLCDKKIWKAFYQLVEQQKILWTVCQINGKNNTKFEKLFPTCGTTKTSLGILSWINNASNKKTWKAFTHLWNNNKFSGYFLSDQQQKQYKIWKAFSNLWNNKNFFGHFVMDQQRKQ
jgi:uncharacterized protein RhaS with RHS repeats